MKKNLTAVAALAIASTAAASTPGEFRFPKAEDFAPKGNSEAIVPVAAKESAEVIASPAAATKADKARDIFKQCYAMDTVPARKDIISRAIAEAGLTKAGAATYLQNFKNKEGLSVKKATTATA